jgi:hypothetical protein
MGSEFYLGLNKSARRSLSHLIAEISSPRNVTALWQGETGRVATMSMLMLNTAETSDFVIEGEWWCYVEDSTCSWPA